MKRLHITSTGDAVFAAPVGALMRAGRGQAEAVPDAVAPSDAEIIARVAKRRAYNLQAQAVERAAREKALDAHVRAKCAELGIGLEVLEHPTSRAELTRTLGSSFKHDIGRDTAAAGMVAVHRMSAAQELPDCCKSERWATGDCQCVVERVYHRDCPEDSHTFHAEPCEAHAGLAIDELHDVLEEETLRRATTHRWLEEQGFGLPGFEWSGAGASRKLIARVPLGDRTTKDFEALASAFDEFAATLTGAVEVAAGG